MNEFKELGLSESILKAIEKKRFESPTEIQKRSIPLVLEGKDIIGGSSTGSGKTLAFGAGIIQNCEKLGKIQALVLTPTRELAEQVSKEIQFFGEGKPLNYTTVYGGVAINPQMDKLKTTDVVVGTPGRLLDHLQRGTIDLSNVKILVLDEADIMLDMGFIDDVKKIVSQCRKERQTLLFSATIEGPISSIVKNYMKSPTKVSVASQVDPKKLKQVYYDVRSNAKLSLLVYLIKEEQDGLVMVFCNTRRYVDVVAKSLKGAGVDSIAIHGGLTQAKRNDILDKFANSNKVYVLVCTDVAARGLDITGVSHVYNYDLPNDPKQYVHRIGRTARAGAEGKAINILSENDHANFYKVLREIDVQVEKLPTPKTPRVEIKLGPRRNDKGHYGRQSYGPPRTGNRNNSGSRRGSSHGHGPRKSNTTNRQKTND